MSANSIKEPHTNLNVLIALAQGSKTIVIPSQDMVDSILEIARRNGLIASPDQEQAFKNELLPFINLFTIVGTVSIDTESNISRIDSLATTIIKHKLPINLDKDASLIKTVSLKDQRNIDFILSAIKLNKDVLLHVDKQLKSNKNFILSLLEYDLSILEDIKPWLNIKIVRSIRDEIEKKLTEIDLLKKDRLEVDRDTFINLLDIYYKLKDGFSDENFSWWDKDIAKKAIEACDCHWDYLNKLVMIDARFFKILPEELKINEDFVLESYSVNEQIINHIDDDLWKNENFIRKIIEEFKRVKLKVFDSEKTNEEFYHSIKKIIKFVNCIIDSSDDSLMEVIENYTSSLLIKVFQLTKVSNNKSLLLMIAKRYPKMSRFFLRDLFNDLNFLIECCMNVIELTKSSDYHSSYKRSRALDFVPIDFWNNIEFIKKMLHNLRDESKYTKALVFYKFLFNYLKFDDNILLELIEIDCHILNSQIEMGKKRSDKAFMLSAITRNNGACEYLSEDLKNDPEIKEFLQKKID